MIKEIMGVCKISNKQFHGGRQLAAGCGSKSFTLPKGGAEKGICVAAFLKKSRMAVMAVIASGYMILGAHPVFAKNTASSAAVTAAAPDNALSPMNGGDERFRYLFSSWEATGNGDLTGSDTGGAIAIPSRMPLAAAILTSNYGMRTHPVLGGRRNHKGVDLAAPTGTPVYATADGLVAKAKRFSSYGLFIQIEHGANLQTRFAHMSRLAVTAGQRVRKGELIGYVGSTGRSTGPHLHYEVRVEGVAVNPIPYMVESDAQQAFALLNGNGGRGGPE